MFSTGHAGGGQGCESDHLEPFFCGQAKACPTLASGARRLLFVLRHVALHELRECPVEYLPRALRSAHLLLFNPQDRQQVARGGSDKALVGGFQVRRHQGLFANRDSGQVDFAQQHLAGDSRQAAGPERRRPPLAAVGDKDVGRSALGHFAALVEENHFIEAAGLRGFEPSQVHGQERILVPANGHAAWRAARTDASLTPSPHCFESAVRAIRSLGRPTEGSAHIPGPLRTIASRSAALYAWLASTSSSSFRRTSPASSGMGMWNAAASRRIRAQWRSKANSTPSATRKVVKTPHPESRPA